MQKVGCTDWWKHVCQYQGLSQKIPSWNWCQNYVGYDNDGDGDDDDDDDGGGDGDDHRASLTSVCALFLYSEIFSGLIESPLE